MALAASVQLNLAGDKSKTAEVIGTLNSRLTNNHSKDFTDGTGNSQVNKRYLKTLAIAASGSSSHDLSGSIVDEFGDAQVFTAVKILKIVHEAASAASGITVAGNWVTTRFGASSSWPIEKGGMVLLVNPLAGWAVTNTTADTLTITNTDGAQTATVTVAVVGVG